MKLSKVTRIAEKAPAPSLMQRFEQSMETPAQPEQVNEGPFDFIRGAAGETRRKASNAVQGAARAVAQPVRDVVAAGRTASAQGDLEKLVAQLAALLQQQAQVAAEPEAAPAQPAAQQAAPVKREPSSPAAFRAEHKPRMTQGKYGAEFKFESMSFKNFMEGISAEQIDEGIWDFVKGAGKEAGNKIRTQINKYADRPSALKDIMQAGVNAHTAAKDKQRAEAIAALPGRIKETQAQIQALARQLGPDALTMAIKKMGGTQANTIMKMMGQQPAPAQAAPASTVGTPRGPRVQAAVDANNARRAARDPSGRSI